MEIVIQGLYRTDTGDYPEEALREALLNSLVHRDYSFSASTLVSVYDDRIEFVSIGGLPAGIELDDIMLGLSVCRNSISLFIKIYDSKIFGGRGTKRQREPSPVSQERSVSMGSVFFFEWEIDIILWLQGFVNGFTTAFAKFLQICGEEYVLIFVLGMLYWSIDKKLGRRASLAMVGSMLFGILIKGLVLRRRPYMDNDRIKCITAPHKDGDIMSVKEQGYSFPSLHSSMSAATYGTVAVSTRKKVTIAIGIIMPVLIGLSRPFLGVHYPTDVLAGWALGIICIFVLCGIENKYNYRAGFLVTLIAGIPGFFYCTDTEFYSGYGVALGLFLGFVFEEKYVEFEYCEKWWTYILRPSGGVAVFFVLTILLKIPMQIPALEETGTAALIYRLFRYTLSTFVTIGVYPFAFKLCKNKF